MSDSRNRQRLADILRRAYRTTHDEELALAAIPDDTAVLLQYLRIGITPAEHVAEQYELTVRQSVTNVVHSAASFPEELRRFRRLSPARRQKLHDDLMAAEGYAWHNGQWVPDPEGHGNEVEVFIHDDRTGQNLTRSGIGTHALAVYALYDLVRPAELGSRWPLSPSERRLDMMTRAEAFVCGFLLTVPGWQTPFLHLWEKEPTLSLAKWTAMARRVQQQHRILVAFHDGRHVPSRSTR